MTGHEQSRRVTKHIEDKFLMHVLKELNRANALPKLLLINRAG